MGENRSREDQVRELEGILCDAGCNDSSADEVADGLIQEAELRERNRILDEVHKLVDLQMKVLAEGIKDSDSSFLVEASRAHLETGLKEIRELGKKF